MPQPVTALQRQYVERLHQRLCEQGAAPRAILDAFLRLPRHRFIDALIVPESDQPGAAELAVAVGPDAADPDLLDRVYTDSALSIQIRQGRCTSSTSQPSLMAMMMADVGLGPGARVLEIGTASGWNAALMSELCGPEGEVVTVEFDAELAERAREHLESEGLGGRVSVVTGDGVLGWPAGAPYDAVIVTVSCPDLPRAWLEQLADGGRLVMPFGLPDESSPMLLLTRRGDGWEGAFLRWSWFVFVRGGGLRPWPAPLDPAGDPDLAALLRREPVCVKIPVGTADRWSPGAASFGLHLLAAGTPGLATVLLATHEARRQVCYALHEPAAGGLAALCDDELRGYGNPGCLERLRDRFGEWTRLGYPWMEDYRVSVHPPGLPAAPLALRRPETTLDLELPENRQRR
ncbi:MAG: protein-L-isoaspartate O-methyltransferase [Armatimonadetes bacterium]|nr:protein-L-isoaspartate O-methyltransferase [Armatimonadota bacterium]